MKHLRFNSKYVPAHLKELTSNIFNILQKIDWIQFHVTTLIMNLIKTGKWFFSALYVAVPPSIRPDPPDGNYVVKKGRKVELKCIASGNPDPTITWTRQVLLEVLTLLFHFIFASVLQYIFLAHSQKCWECFFDEYVNILKTDCLHLVMLRLLKCNWVVVIAQVLFFNLLTIVSALCECMCAPFRAWKDKVQRNKFHKKYNNNCCFQSLWDQQSMENNGIQHRKEKEP